MPQKWADLKVGDLVKLRDKESVPADIVVIATSEPSGVAYCSTATLDGERTLKLKQAMDEIQEEYERMNGSGDIEECLRGVKIEC